MSKKKIAVIGGGTGTYNLLVGLKKYPVDLSVIVTMSDSGGSSGRLRDEFGVLPPGDVRQALVALADNGDSDVLRKLFLYRFDKGEGLAGHNFGNIFLTALTDIVGSEQEAITYAAKLLRIQGKVIPVTASKTDLCAELEDGFVVKGEHHIDEPSHNGMVAIKSVWLEPSPFITPEAEQEILKADLVVIGPGDLYTSLIVNLLVKGVTKALIDQKIAFVANLVSKYGQSYKYCLANHVRDVEKYLKRKVDYILYNETKLPPAILRKYRDEKGYAVLNDMNGDERVIAKDLIVGKLIKKRNGDVLKRSMIRHDSEKLAQAVYDLL